MHRCEFDWHTSPDHGHSLTELEPKGNNQKGGSSFGSHIQVLEHKRLVEHSSCRESKQSSQGSVVDLAHQFVLREILPCREAFHFEEMLLRVKEVLSNHRIRIACISCLGSGGEETCYQNKWQKEMDQLSYLPPHSIICRNLLEVCD